MNLFPYQSYYLEDQIKFLDSNFIPYNNTENSQPELRELPMWRKLFNKHRNTDAYWGLLSWRWSQKTNVPPSQFKQWILLNPGYDVYHLDPFSHLANQFPNLWVQGDLWHSGMINFAQKLFTKLGINTPIYEYKYQPDEFGTCNYFIGNDRFWSSYMKFIDTCLEHCDADPSMSSYLYKEGGQYNGLFVPNFSFVIERLFSMHNILNRHIKAKKYT
jgi:hypothetical protein